MSGSLISRRGILKIGVLAAASCLFPYKSIAAAAVRIPPEKRLSFYNTHTGESLETVYWAGEEYLPGALAEINHLLRDHRTGEVKAIDTRLLDLLHALGGALEARQPFHVISGYRSPRTNAILRRRSRNVARNSLHLKGMAIDIRLPGRDLSLLRRAALEIQGGGVGYYPGSNFVHVDVGRVRRW